MITKTIAISALALVIGVTAADAAQRPHRARHARVTQPATPAPAEIARLAALHGRWVFDGMVTMGKDKPRKARWRMNCKESAGGWALACDETIYWPRMPAMRGHTMFGYDGATSTVHLFTVNNMGEVRDMPGKWIDDHTIHYRYDGTQGGKPMVQEADVILHDESSFDIDLKITLGGEPQAAFHGTFHKAPARPRRARGGTAAAPYAEPTPETPSQ